MNRTTAFIALGSVVCLTAPAFSQDTHVLLTRESVACMHDIATALDKASDQAGVDEAVKTIQTVRGKLVGLGKRQLELPGATPQEQAQIAAAMVEVQKATVELTQALFQLRKKGLFTPELQQALLSLQTVQAELAEASQAKADQAEPFPQDAGGNTHESLLVRTLNEVKKLDAVMAAVKDEATSASAVAQVNIYRDALLDIAKKQAALPPLTRNQQAKLQGLQTQLVEMMQPVMKHVTSAMMLREASPELKKALQSLADLPAELQKVREAAVK